MLRTIEAETCCVIASVSVAWASIVLARSRVLASCVQTETAGFPLDLGKSLSRRSSASTHRILLLRSASPATCLRRSAPRLLGLLQQQRPLFASRLVRLNFDSPARPSARRRIRQLLVEPAGAARCHGRPAKCCLNTALHHVINQSSRNIVRNIARLKWSGMVTSVRTPGAWETALRRARDERRASSDAYEGITPTIAAAGQDEAPQGSEREVVHLLQRLRLEETAMHELEREHELIVDYSAKYESALESLQTRLEDSEQLRAIVQSGRSVATEELAALQQELQVERGAPPSSSFIGLLGRHAVAEAESKRIEAEAALRAERELHTRAARGWRQLGWSCRRTSRRAARASYSGGRAEAERPGYRSRTPTRRCRRCSVGDTPTR